MTAHFRKSGVIVDRRQIRAPHRTVAVEQFAGTEHGLVVIFVGRSLKIADGGVDFVFLPEFQCGIQPGRRVVRIQFFGESKFLCRRLRVAQFARRLAEIAAEQTALRLQCRRRLKGRACFDEVPFLHQTKPASQPCLTERGVKFARLVEVNQGNTGLSLIKQDETLKGVGRGQP